MVSDLSGWGEGGDGERTFAPAATALRTRIWHWARLWVMDAVEQSWPIAWECISAR